MQTTLLFLRKEVRDSLTFAIVTFSCEHTVDPNVLLHKFRAAVTKWIKETDEGARAWEYSAEDFNIGDYANYESDEALNQYLAEQGLSVSINIVNDENNTLAYDTVLANGDEI